MEYKAKQKKFLVENFNNLQLYLLSVATGIPVDKKYMEIFQRYIDLVCQFTKRQNSKIEDSEIFAIFLGKPEDEAVSIREQVLDFMRTNDDQVNQEDLKKINDSHNDHLHELLNTHKDIMTKLPVAQYQLFDDLTREFLWLYAAMLVPEAKSLRRYHLGTSEITQEEVVRKFEIDLSKYYEEYFLKQTTKKEDKNSK